MDNLVNSLRGRKFCVIMSVATGLPYLDEKYGCYFFEKKKEAIDFIEDAKIVDGIKLKYEDIKEIDSYILKKIIFQGAKIIIVKIDGEPDYFDIKVSKLKIKDNSYKNSILNGLICQLKQTKKAKYLRAMRKTHFIMPILVDKRKEGAYPSMHYIYATMGKTKPYYVLFSTLNEFENWNRNQPGKWDCIEIIMEDFNQIRLKNAVVINPMTDKLVLTGKQVDMISEEKKK